MVVQAEDDPTYSERFLTYVKERPDLGTHPAFALLVAAQLEYECTERNESILNAQMDEINSLTGNGQLFFVNHPTFHIKSESLQRISDAVHSTITNFLDEKRRTKVNLDFSEQIVKFIDRACNLSAEDRKDCWNMKDLELRRHADYVSSRWKVLLRGLEIDDQATQIYLSLVG